MSALVVGDTVSIGCPICRAPMDPYRKTCGRECARELDWRRALVCTNSAYELDPESRLGKLAAKMDSRKGEGGS